MMTTKIGVLKAFLHRSLFYCFSDVISITFSGTCDIIGMYLLGNRITEMWSCCVESKKSILVWHFEWGRSAGRLTKHYKQYGFTSSIVFFESDISLRMRCSIKTSIASLSRILSRRGLMRCKSLCDVNGNFLSINHFISF